MEHRDGVHFDVDRVCMDRTPEDNEYGGFRIRTTAWIKGTRIAVTIDIGFGDATEPSIETSSASDPLLRLASYYIWCHFFYGAGS